MKLRCQQLLSNWDHERPGSVMLSAAESEYIKQIIRVSEWMRGVCRQRCDGRLLWSQPLRQCKEVDERLWDWFAGRWQQQEMVSWLVTVCRVRHTGLIYSSSSSSGALTNLKVEGTSPAQSVGLRFCASVAILTSVVENLSPMVALKFLYWCWTDFWIWNEIFITWHFLKLFLLPVLVRHLDIQ